MFSTLLKSLPCKASFVHLKKSQTMNRLMQAAGGELICFVSPNFKIGLGFLTRIRELFTENQSLAAVGGVPAALPGQGAWAEAVETIQNFNARKQDYWTPELNNVVFRTNALLKAGGFSGTDPDLGTDTLLYARLENLGFEIAFDHNWPIRKEYAETLSQNLLEQLYLAKNWAASKPRGETPWPGMALECAIVMLGLGLLISLLPYDMERALTLSLVCFMVNYYPNRPLFKFVTEKKPELMGKSFVFAVLRPFFALPGLFWGSIRRLGLLF
jgi:hypothetical protein